MKKKALFSLSLVLLLATTLLARNADGSDPVSSSNAPAFPRVIRFSGTLPSGNTTVVGVTFVFYKEQTGGVPLWQEVQNVNPDANGHYAVLLGSTQSEGLPADLFSSTEARWLGVKIEGGEEQTRVQLVSVPYALHAADAETLGGKPLSSFVLNEPTAVGAKVAAAKVVPFVPSTPVAADIASSNGTTNFVAKWTNGTTLGNSMIFDNGTSVGVGTTTPQAPLDVNGGAGGSIFRGFSALFITPASFGPQFDFRNAATPVGASWRIGVPGFANATSFFIYDYVNQNSILTIEKGAGLNSLYFKAGGNLGVGTTNPTSKFTVVGPVESTTGGFKFPDATMQTTAALGTVTGVTAGTDLTGGGTSGVVTLNLDTTKVVTGVTVGTGLTGGGTGGNVGVALDQTFTDGRYAKLAGGNTFTGAQSVTGNVTSTGTISGNLVNTSTLYSIAGTPVLSASGGTNGNLFVGLQTGTSDTTGQKNTFIGTLAGFKNTSGASNVFAGAIAGEFTVSGNENAFLGFNAGNTNSTGSGNTYIGANAGFQNNGNENVYLGHNTGQLLLSESNTMRLGNPSTTANTYVAGIFGTTTGANDAIPVVVDSNGQLGTVVSSRRFKENIRSMGDETNGLFRLRPVSFYYRPDVDKSQKRLMQYGLIAEEVAQVYPELVVYDKEGQPYTVKYQYLTPMLLNEVQKQHATIADQQSVIESQNEQIQNLAQRLERLEKLMGTVLRQQ